MKVIRFECLDNKEIPVECGGKCSGIALQIGNFILCPPSYDRKTVRIIDGETGEFGEFNEEKFAATIRKHFQNNF